ncbi:hypothetical protein CLU79DRAFT_743305 [Phycomyces nitens]|nr:hypothetical protein CLU79DRAFT_743305 [Phycomyces nitens]
MSKSFISTRSVLSKQHEADQVSSLSHIFDLMYKRLKESKETIAYSILITVSAIICIVLEILITASNGNEISAILQSYNQINDHSNPTSDVTHVYTDNAYVSILVNLRRQKDKNIFFILFQLFQTYLGIDAIVRQNTIQLIAHGVFQFICFLFSLLQFIETRKGKLAMSSVDETMSQAGFTQIIYYEIGQIAYMAVFILLLAFLTKRLLGQLGWNIYKRIGADLRLQARFRLCLLFLLNLKLDAFFHLFFSVFWFVVMTREKYYNINSAYLAWYIIHLLLTICQIPALYLARKSILTENRKFMTGCLTVHGLTTIDFIIILQQSLDSWVFWIIAVCLAIALSFSTIVLAILVLRNFGKGLKPHIKRLSDKGHSYTMDKRDPNFTTHPSSDSWVIDRDSIDSRQNKPPSSISFY